MAQRVHYDAGAGSEPFDTDLVIERLAQITHDDGRKALQQVRGAADYAAIQAISDFRPPEAFVVLARETGMPMPGQSRQAAIAAFGVVLAVRNYSYKRGKPAMDALRPLLGLVRQQLVGWIPANAAGVALPGARGCTWQSGDVVDYDKGTLLWSEVYTTQHFIGSKTP